MKTYTVEKAFNTLVQKLRAGDTVDETIEQELAFPLTVAVLVEQEFLSEHDIEEAAKPSPAVVPPAEFSAEK